MKKTIYTLAIIGLSLTARAQTNGGFENITLLPNSYWNGSDTSNGGFATGNVWLNNKWDTAFGGNWSGFAVSKNTDSVTSGFGNQYSSANGKGVGKAPTYGVAYHNPMYPVPSVVLTGQAAGKELRGFWVNNTAYAYWDMKNGSSFSKKFGGSSGNDSDWFRLTVTGYKGGSMVSKKVEFMLADFTNSDNSKDYIVKDWQWVDCKPLGNVDSIHLTLSSSDTGTFGMNTPAYFAIDNIVTNDFGTAVAQANVPPAGVYPNPAANSLYLANWIPGARLIITDVNGRELKTETLGTAATAVDVSLLPAGVYVMKLQVDAMVFSTRFVKL